MKCIHIWSFSGAYFPAFGLNTFPYLFLFSPNAEKYGPEKLGIRTLFMQCSGMKWVKRLLNYKLSNNDCDGTQMRNSLVRKRTLKFQISRLLRRV